MEVAPYEISGTTEETAMKRYREKQDAIKTLFEYEEKNDIPDEERLTYDPYKDIEEIPDPSPRKKAYVDIRWVEGKVSDLKYQGDI